MSAVGVILDAFTKQYIIVHDARFWKQRLGHRDPPLLLSLGAVGRWTWEYRGKELAWEQPATMSEAHDSAHIPAPRQGPHWGEEPPEGPDPAPNPALSMVLQERPYPIVGQLHCHHPAAAPFLYSGRSLWLTLSQMLRGHLQLANPSSNTRLLTPECSQRTR